MLYASRSPPLRLAQGPRNQAEASMGIEAVPDVKSFEISAQVNA